MSEKCIHGKVELDAFDHCVELIVAVVNRVVIRH